MLGAGDHVPVTPFVEVVGNVNGAPIQIAGTCVNTGATVPTWIVMVVVVPHCPASGVNV